jgi:hypothetical protein
MFPKVLMLRPGYASATNNLRRLEEPALKYDVFRYLRARLIPRPH